MLDRFFEMVQQAISGCRSSEIATNLLRGTLFAVGELPEPGIRWLSKQCKNENKSNSEYKILRSTCSPTDSSFFATGPQRKFVSTGRRHLRLWGVDFNHQVLAFKANKQREETALNTSPKPQTPNPYRKARDVSLHVLSCQQLSFLELKRHLTSCCRESSESLAVGTSARVLLSHGTADQLHAQMLYTYIHTDIPVYVHIYIYPHAVCIYI